MRPVFAGMAQRRSEAVIVQPIFGGHQDRIIALARPHRIAVVSNYRLFADAGAVFSYGPDDLASAQRAAYYVDRILRGTPAGTCRSSSRQPSASSSTRRPWRDLALSLPPSLAAEAFDVIE